VTRKPCIMRHMAKRRRGKVAHPKGEEFQGLPSLPPAHRVDTFGGPLHVKWEADSEVTAHGSITYFIEFLKVSGLWEDWVRDCPLASTSPNAPRKEEILGTILLSGRTRSCRNYWGWPACAAKTASVAPSLTSTKMPQRCGWTCI